MAECDKFLCGKESFLVTLPFKVTNKNPYLTKKRQGIRQENAQNQDICRGCNTEL